MGFGELQQIGLGLGIQEGESGGGLKGDTGTGGGGGNQEEEVRDREWRETVRNLLLVVDGMVSLTLSLSLSHSLSKVSWELMRKRTSAWGSLNNYRPMMNWRLN